MELESLGILLLLKKLKKMEFKVVVQSSKIKNIYSVDLFD